MKVELPAPIAPRRGGDVAVGNVYSNDHCRYYRIVVAVIEHNKRRGRVPWNNVVCLHVDATGEICGASCQPIQYVINHQDLVGVVREMPTMRVEWFKDGGKK